MYICRRTSICNKLIDIVLPYAVYISYIRIYSIQSPSYLQKKNAIYFPSRFQYSIYWNYHHHFSSDSINIYHPHSLEFKFIFSLCVGKLSNSSFQMEIQKWRNSFFSLRNKDNNNMTRNIKIFVFPSFIFAFNQWEFPLNQHNRIALEINIRILKT